MNRIPRVRFGVLGDLQVRRFDESLVSLGGRRPRSLLALLLLNAGRVVTTDSLIYGLYGSDPPGDAPNALQSQVSRLRRGLRDQAGFGGVVEFQPAGYRLAVDPDEVDAFRFERLAREGRSLIDAGYQDRATTLLDEALALWRGPALADVAGAPFAEAHAARLDDLRLIATQDRAEAYLALGENRGMVAELQALVAAHPLCERPRGLLMRALHGSGRSAEALAVFEDARRTLASELGTSPSAELAAVHLSVLRAESPCPAQPVLPPRPAGPPAPFTSFVGRADEISRIGSLLSATRLVTLTGPGGVGKTRLAIEALRPEKGEVCFVDLTQLRDNAHVPGAVLRALGLGESPVERLVPALTDRQMLLVLDNCEQVVDGAARLVQRLLGTVPDLRILATSREALGITGESLCPVPPLGRPAVRLFADRAAAVQPDFEVDTASLDTVAAICAALDGLPLAVELAAALLCSLTLDEVTAGLDDRFKLLSRGSRTAAARHQTLRALVGWSWDLLGDAERTLAMRLTVFTGGASREAVRRVCGMGDDLTDELLADLAAKSFVECRHGRYRMLETIRVYCAGQLAGRPEAMALRQAHARYYLDLARAAEGRLADEHGNLHAALRWTVRTETAAHALRLIAACRRSGGCPACTVRTVGRRRLVGVSR